MKLTKIEMGPSYNHGYDIGAEPGIKCEVEFQPAGYGSRFTIKLDDEQTKKVVALAAQLALEGIRFDPETIDVVGKAGTPRPETAEETVGGARPSTTDQF